MIWDLHTYLLVDPQVVLEESGTSLVREEAQRAVEGPIVGERDRALLLGGSPRGIGAGVVPVLVVLDGPVVRLWYQLRGVAESGKTDPETVTKHAPVAYAESDDGVHFRPVRVGRVEWNGSTDNNLVDFGLPLADVRLSGFLHDPLDRAFPFKCVYARKRSGRLMDRGVLARWPHLAEREWYFVWGIGRSRDGLAWEPPAHGHFLINAAPEHARLHRAIDGGLVISDQMMHPMADWAYRNVKGWIAYDDEALQTAHEIPDYVFSLPQHMVRVDNQYVGSAWQGHPWIQPHVGLVCLRKGPTIVGLNGYLYGAIGVETFAQTADIGLTVSASGTSFREVWPFYPFLRRGLPPAWDHGLVVQAGVVDTADHTLIYYAGGDGNFSPYYWMGLAQVPRDRYGYRMIRGYRQTEPRDAGGTVVLKPCALPERPALAINVSHVSERQTVRAELRDERGVALPGYSFEESRAVTEAGLRQSLSWGPRRGEDLGGQRVSIALRLESPGCRLVRDESPRVYAVYTG